MKPVEPCTGEEIIINLSKVVKISITTKEWTKYA